MKRKVINMGLLVLLLFSTSFQQQNLKRLNLKSQRVQLAYKKNWPEMQEKLKKTGCNPNAFSLFIRVFKQDKIVEAWVKSKEEQEYKLYKCFEICASSGNLGPKRRQGDLQVPEGFYKIPSLHPYSNYHLALKVSYPNSSDRIKASSEDPGGDIMIHGECVTIGCIPLRNGPVEELFILALESMNSGHEVSCHIFPFRLSEKNMNLVAEKYPQSTISFWQSLKLGYDMFELNHRLPKIMVDKKGNYNVVK